MNVNKIIPLETDQSLGQWEPQKTKRIEAEAEAVKKYAKAIQDWTLLDEAIEQQIENQRRFVEWWTANVRSQGEVHKEIPERRFLSVAEAEELSGISAQKVSRWKKRLEDIGAYRTLLRGPAYRVAMASDVDNNTYTNSTTNSDTNNTNTDDSDNTDETDDSDDVDVPIIFDFSDPVGKIIRGTMGTGEFERYTPAKYIEIARSVMGTIDVDPASCEVAQKIVKATTFFTTKDSGLSKDWIGNVWLNPPYHRELGPMFVNKLISERLAGRATQAIMLTNNSTDTDWFVKAQVHCHAICFAKARIAFLEEDGVTEVAPTQGQAFFYFGNNMELFCKEFRKIGFIAINFVDYRVA